MTPHLFSLERRVISTLQSRPHGSQQRRRRLQRERQESKRFTLVRQQLCTCITLFNLYISWPSSHDYNVKVPNFIHFTFCTCRGRQHKTTTFFFFSGTWIRSPLEFTSKQLDNIWRIERDGISAIKFEAAQIHFLNFKSDVFVCSRRRRCCSAC